MLNSLLLLRVMMLCMMQYVQEKKHHKNAERKKKHNQRAEKYPKKVKIVSHCKNVYTRMISIIDQLFGLELEWEESSLTCYVMKISFLKLQFGRKKTISK